MLSFVNVFLIFSVLLGNVWCVEFVFDYLFFLKGCAGKILRSLCEIRSEMGTHRGDRGYCKSQDTPLYNTAQSSGLIPVVAQPQVTRQ